MPAYAYKARTIAGKIVQGEIEAVSMQEAAHWIRQQKLFISSLRERRMSRWSAWLFFMDREQKQLFFCRQLSVMLQAGFSLSDSLQMLSGQERKSRWKAVLLSIYKEVQAGRRFADALQQQRHFFSTTLIQVMAAGENSGTLEVIVPKLTISIEKNYKNKENMKTAMLYPGLLFIAAILAMGFLLIFVLPTFVALFRDLQVELPLPTRCLLAISNFVILHAIVLVLFVFGFVFLSGILVRKPSVRLGVDELRLQLPVLGTYYRNVELVRLLNVLGILLASGMVLDRALEIAASATENHYLQQVLQKTRFEVQKGYGIAAVLGKYSVFPAILLQLLSVGENTGNLEQLLEKAAEICRFEADCQAERIQALLEPLLILFLGIVIGGIILAIALPMLDSALLMY